MADDPRLPAVIQTLLDEGAAPENSIHSWRCSFPARYGECTCVEELARAVLDTIDTLQ